MRATLTRRMIGLCLLALLPGLAQASPMLDVDDEAPALMLYSYNEDVARKVADTNTPALGQFLGTSPERPKDAVLLVFIDRANGTAADLEMLARLQRKYSSWGQGLQVLVVGITARAADLNESLSAARGVNYPVLRDRFQIVAERYGVSRASTPTAFLLIGERPDVELTPHEQSAIKEAYTERAYEWTVRIKARWTGDLLPQEEAIMRSVEAVVDR